MPALKDDKLAFVKKLYYKDGLSMKRVSETLNVSIDAVSYFMRRHGLKRRTFREDNRLRFEKKPLSFRIKNKLTREDELLK